MSQAKFNVWDASHEEGYAAWLALWQRWPLQEVYAHPGYVRLYAEAPHRAICAALQSDQGCVLYPFIMRSIGGEPWCVGLPALHDLITPYGYGGPFFWGEGDREEVATRFWTQFDQWAASQAVVSEFIRFSLFSDALLPYPGQREVKQENVICPLDQGDELRWMSFEHKVRKNVNKAKKSGLSILFDPEGQRLDDFLHIYRETMDRRSAASGYYFSRAYFERLQREIPGQYMYVHALHEGQVVSTELVLVSKEAVYSFLGGTDSDAFDLRPNDLLKYEIMRWASGEQKRFFVLGGGYQPDDGIFRYKLSFAPTGRAPFHVGHRVFQHGSYAELIAQRSRYTQEVGETWEPKTGYFPAYRS